MNKSMATNLVAFSLVVLGVSLAWNWLFWAGVFALSGALTNWLAIHMLFNRVPGLVGSGVIPNRFEAFKEAIRHLMMQQFFNQTNIDRFMADQSNDLASRLQLTPVIEKLDVSPAYDRLVDVIMKSSFGSMLGMFGGAEALRPLQEPFESNLKSALVEMVEKPEFLELLQQQVDQPDNLASIQHRIESIIDTRLQELTPELVKQMVEQMMAEHLGWLVVWGGVFGGLIGLLSVGLSSWMGLL